MGIVQPTMLQVKKVNYNLNNMKKEFDFGIECTAKDFNTNNSWGFCGGIGIDYTFNDKLSAKIGRAFYRHLPSQNYITITLDGKRIFDKYDNSKNRLEAKEIINKICKQENF